MLNLKVKESSKLYQETDSLLVKVRSSVSWYCLEESVVLHFTLELANMLLTFVKIKSARTKDVGGGTGNQIIV